MIYATAILSLTLNAVLFIAYAAEHNRRRQAESQAYFYEKQTRELAQSMKASLRRDPKTGRYLKKGS